MNDTHAIAAEEILPVRSRVSWGAIFAGAVIALALYFLLTLLGGAIGLSVDSNVSSDRLGTGAAIWAIATTLLALFIGGFVTSQCTAGENKVEAALYGVIVWGLLFAMLIWLMATGVRAGFNAMVGMASFNQSMTGTSMDNWESAARRAGVPQEQIEDWRRRAATAPENVRQAVQDPQNQQAVSESTTRAAWYAFAGTLLSILAAVGGALVGSGPTLQLLVPRLSGGTVMRRETAVVR